MAIVSESNIKLITYICNIYFIHYVNFIGNLESMEIIIRDGELPVSKHGNNVHDMCVGQ